MKLLVRNLARTTTQEQIRHLFHTHGDVSYCTLIHDTHTGQSKGFAFVEMPQEIQAKEALKTLNLTEFDGSKIRVKPARD